MSVYPIHNKIRKLFGCKWEYLGKNERNWMYGNDNVPKWVHAKTIRLRPGTVGEFKGKTFVYKVIRQDTATNYGQTPAVFYRRLRYKAFKRGQR